ncbi:hypothetical protein J6590_010229 [Homalodisca vitripennis]|nr:hypothetical protein J6590_010229 [Homalodisca vitripennis]
MARRGGVGTGTGEELGDGSGNRWKVGDSPLPPLDLLPDKLGQRVARGMTSVGRCRGCVNFPKRPLRNECAPFFKLPARDIQPGSLKARAPVKLSEKRYKYGPESSVQKSGSPKDYGSPLWNSYARLYSISKQRLQLDPGNFPHTSARY